MIEIVPLRGIGEIVAGDDLAAVLAPALASHRPRAGEVVVVTHKIVSKAEGRVVALADVTPGARARALARATGGDPRLGELVLGEATAIVRIAPNVLIVRHRSGAVMANAGIDRSNAGPGGEDRAIS